jgi:methyl coenzyme M reductase subunit C-like uncharacterized protein (methanogenesis marker protein 7)
VLRISDLTTYSMATSSGKEQTSGKKQFDARFLKQLKELITQVIQEERRMGSSPPRTPPALKYRKDNEIEIDHKLLLTMF